MCRGTFGWVCWQMELSIVYRESGQSELAAQHAKTAIELQESLLNRYPELAAQHRVFLYALRLENSRVMIERAEFDDAMVELKVITQSVEKLVTHPKLEQDWHTLRVLTASYESLARVSDELGKAHQANEARRRADQYRKRLYQICG